MINREELLLMVIASLMYIPDQALKQDLAHELKQIRKQSK